jgi:hypothetical protein
LEQILEYMRMPFQAAIESPVSAQVDPDLLNPSRWSTL